MSRRTLIVAQPRNSATGAVQTVRLGGGGRAALYHDGHHYRAGVVRSPRFAARLSFDEDGWSGGSLPTTGSVVFAPAQPSLLAELAGLFWKGAAITVLVGDEDGPFPPRLTGTVADAACAGGRLVLTIADLSFGIDKPLATARFAGTGGIEGVSEATGRVKRRSWGRVYNVEGRLIDKANSIYEFGDPARPLQGFDALRDKGSAGTFTGLAWQGSIAATFAALQAATAPAGGGVVAPSIACAKWWTQPSGPLTADLRGETAGGYVEDVVGIAARILTAASGPAINNAAAAAAWRTGTAGLHIGDENETAAQALDRLLLGASLLWVLDPAGAITIRQIGFGASIETLTASSSARQRQLKPTRSRRIGYRRNHRQHSDGEIAAVLRGSDVAYADNTPIDSLKPQEAGANKTETRTASAIAGQAATATSSDFSAVTGTTKPEANATVGGIFGVNLRELVGGVFATLANFKTSLGNAAGFAGQGSLATQNAIAFQSAQLTGRPRLVDQAFFVSGFPSAAEMVYGDGTGVQALRPQEGNANRTEIRTAAAISGQGGFATAPTLTRLNIGSYFNPNAFSLNYTITRADGASIVTESLSITSLGISAGFAGQGALASKNAVDWNSADIINKPALSVNRITRSHTAAPGAYIEIQLAPNETVPVQVYWRAQRTAGADGNIAGAVEVSDNGSSWNTVLTTAPAFVGISEPAGRNASGFFTNTTGFTRTFAFRFNATGATAGLDFIPLGQNFVSVG